MMQQVPLMRKTPSCCCCLAPCLPCCRCCCCPETPPAAPAAAGRDRQHPCLAAAAAAAAWHHSVRHLAPLRMHLHPLLLLVQLRGLVPLPKQGSWALLQPAAAAAAGCVRLRGRCCRGRARLQLPVLTVAAAWVPCLGCCCPEALMLQGWTGLGRLLLMEHLTDSCAHKAMAAQQQERRRG